MILVVCWEALFSRGSINGLTGPVCPAAHKRADLAGLPHLQPLNSTVMGMLCLGAQNAISARCHSIPHGLASSFFQVSSNHHAEHVCIAAELVCLNCSHVLVHRYFEGVVVLRSPDT